MIEALCRYVIIHHLHSFVPGVDLLTVCTTGGVIESVPEWVRIAVVLLSGGLVTYLVRQYVERKKLKRALKTEILKMDGIETCNDALSSVRQPSESGGIESKNLPTEESIPTTVYEENIARLGLLSGDDLERVVGFYTDVLRYKAIISAIREGKDVPEPDQDDLWEEIGDLESKRQSLFGDDWMNDWNAQTNTRY